MTLRSLVSVQRQGWHYGRVQRLPDQRRLRTSAPESITLTIMFKQT